jgi:hypothetical protein
VPARSQVGRHEHCGAAEEREWRLQHPAVSHRQQVRDPRRRLRLQQVDRVRTVLWRTELCQRRPRQHRAAGTTEVPPFSYRSGHARVTASSIASKAKSIASYAYLGDMGLPLAAVSPQRFVSGRQDAIESWFCRDIAELRFCS